jgi:hypothetical protein
LAAAASTAGGGGEGTSGLFAGDAAACAEYGGTAGVSGEVLANQRVVTTPSANAMRLARRIRKTACI